MFIERLQISLRILLVLLLFDGYRSILRVHEEVKQLELARDVPLVRRRGHFLEEILGALRQICFPKILGVGFFVHIVGQIGSKELIRATLPVVIDVTEIYPVFYVIFGGRRAQWKGGRFVRYFLVNRLFDYLVRILLEEKIGRDEVTVRIQAGRPRVIRLESRLGTLVLLALQQTLLQYLQNGLAAVLVQDLPVLARLPQRILEQLRDQRLLRQRGNFRRIFRRSRIVPRVKLGVPLHEGTPTAFHDRPRRPLLAVDRRLRRSRAFGFGVSPRSLFRLLGGRFRRFGRFQQRLRSRILLTALFTRRHNDIGFVIVEDDEGPRLLPGTLYSRWIFRVNRDHRWIVNAVLTTHADRHLIVRRCLGSRRGPSRVAVDQNRRSPRPSIAQPRRTYLQSVNERRCPGTDRDLVHVARLRAPDLHFRRPIGIGRAPTRFQQRFVRNFRPRRVGIVDFVTMLRFTGRR